MGSSPVPGRARPRRTPQGIAEAPSVLRLGASRESFSLDGLLADEGTEYWQFCFGLPDDPAETKQKLEVYQSALAHLMGRTAYEAMAGALPTADDPFSGVLNAGRKVVFSRP